MKYTVEEVMEMCGEEFKHSSKILKIYNEYDGEKDLWECKDLYLVGMTLDMTDYEIVSEVIMFCDVYKLEPFEAVECMDEGFVLFDSGMDKIKELMDEENLNISEAIEQVRGE